MAVLVNCQNLSKSYSSRPLFRDISFTIDDKERLGLIGPNGSGKSTLLKIMASLVEPDQGEVISRKYLKTAYVPQDSKYDPELTIREVMLKATKGFDVSDNKIEATLSRVGFIDADTSVRNLSGGWRKRLALAEQLAKEPDFLLLDEPTNHLDLEGVLWLEELLKSAPFSFVVISHDRNFLENVTNRTIELSAVYKDGFLSVKGPYSQFLEARQEYMKAQAHEEQALASQVRREIAWLQRGARARQTKAQGRIRDAEKLMESFEEVKFRNNQTSSVGIDFNASGRKTKELLVCKGIAKAFGDKKLFSNLDLVFSPGHRLGLLGTNGSGKTTLLKILAGELNPDKGEVKKADNLQIVWFDQNREQLDQKLTLRQALCSSGDSVVYRGRSIHIASWSKRFLFKPDQLNMPISYLSGGEQARILIARLMLMPADILILDEPTNDLDIPSLEVLEESLEEFPGAVVLVTHDRFMLDNISTQLLALDGSGGTRFYADYAQWVSTYKNAGGKDDDAVSRTGSKADARIRDSEGKQEGSAVSTRLRPLSTAEKKELAQMSEKIEQAEIKLEEARKGLEDSAVATNHVKLQERMDEVHRLEEVVNGLFMRWQELEARAQA